MMNKMKVIRILHADTDHHQKLITFRGSPVAHFIHVRSTYVSAFVSIFSSLQTEGMVGGGNNTVIT